MKFTSYYAIPGLPNYEKKRLEPADMIKLTAKFFNLSVSQILSKHRYRELVIARHLFYYYGRAVGYGWRTLAIATGGRDHTTAIHGYKTIADLIEVDKETKKLYDQFHAYMDQQKYSVLQAADLKEQRA